MLKVKGRYNEAIVYTDTLEEAAARQIKALCDQSIFQAAKIRIMPDVHVGKGCVIGFTADLNELVVPNLVGVDLS